MQSKVANIEDKIKEQTSLLQKEKEEKSKIMKQLNDFRKGRREVHALSPLHPRRETMLADTSASLNLNPVEYDGNAVRHSLVGSIQDSANLLFNSTDAPPAYLTTVDPVNGAHVVTTPDKVETGVCRGDFDLDRQVNTLATSIPTEEGPKVQWCQWGTQLVPCSPGYGGAWTEHHPTVSLIV